jgi:thymidylate kinase
MNRPLIIEFAGLPGAGKTTIVDLVAEMERQENLGFLSSHSLLHAEHNHGGKCTTAAHLFQAAVTFSLVFLKKPAMVLHLLRYGLLSRPLCRPRISNVYHFISLARQVDSRKTTVPMEHKAELLDQGLVQCLGAIALPGTPANSKNLEALVPHALADWIDGLVWVECDPETALIRVRSRADGCSRFDSWPDDVFLQNQTIMLKVLRDAIRLAGRAGVPILTVSSVDPPARNAARVRAWLQHVLSSFPRQHDATNSA